jgi:phage/plasmid-associated DNA primase
MSPNSANIEPTTFPQDSIILESKEQYFNSLGFIIGNVKLSFLGNGKKKCLGACKWAELTQSEEITGPNFLIRTGISSKITVFDVDIKTDCNGAVNLLRAGINFDEYKDECIKIKTQSGGFHYIFKYDERFETSTNCFGIKGFDIRNDNGVIFAGDRYDIVSIGKSFNTPTSLDQIFDTLSANIEELKPQPKSEPKQKLIKTTATINDKYYELLNLLPDEWFNDFDKWVKPIYALKNAEDIENDQALATIIQLLNERSSKPNETETRRVFGLDNSKKRFNIGSIINILKKNDESKALWKNWNDKWYPKKQQDSEKKKSSLDILKEKLIEIVESKYKRVFQSGAIYQIIRPYYYRRVFNNPDEFLNVVFKNEHIYNTCKTHDHKELKYFIKNIAHPGFEFIQLDYNYIGFLNGVYDLSNATFINTDDLTDNIQVRTYIESDFEIDNNVAPLLDQYLEYQFDEETIKSIYFMIGRLLTRLNDKFDFMVLLFGKGGSGKSLLMNLVRYLFGADQIAIFGNAHQEKFGLCNYSTKQILCCDDMPTNMAKTLPKSDFLSMMSRGQVSCPVKNEKDTIEVYDWNIPTIMLSNHLPNYKDESGEVIRRIMIINFQKVIKEKDRNTELETQIKEREIGVFLHRCRSTYLEFCSKYKGKGVDTFIAPIFLENRNELRMATNNTYKFISERCKYQEGSYLTVPRLNKAMKEYIKDRYEMKQMPKDTVDITNIILVDSRFVSKKLNICKSCRQNHKTGCCESYSRTNKSSSHVIQNITFSYGILENE